MRQPSFEEMDKDKDGKISKSEWTGLAQTFDEIDENHDGFIDRAEWDKWRTRTMAARMGGSFLRYLDANNDGKVTRDEFAKLTQLFDALDTDHDGFLTSEELGRFNQAMNPNRQGQGQAGGRPGGGDRGPGGDRPNRPQMNFDDLDKDKDGKISKSEWQGPPQFFDRMDANHDGFIDKQEWEAWRSRAAGGGAGPGRITDSVLKYLDTNHDGKVSRDEFAKITQIFDALDKNHDGALTAEELGGFYQAVGQAPTQATGGVDVDSFFAKYDKNKDGKITPDELDNEKLFKVLDLNHDGVITREEADQALRDLAARAKQKKDSGK
jgi:Ca2+-binding EF-hand superfamily protein